MRSIRCADTAAVCIQQIKRGSSNFNIHDQRFSKREIKLSCKSVVQTGFSTLTRRNKGKWDIFCKYWDYECLDSLISFWTRKEIRESSSLAFIIRFFFPFDSVTQRILFERKVYYRYQEPIMGSCRHVIQNSVAESAWFVALAWVKAKNDVYFSGC